MRRLWVVSKVILRIRTLIPPVVSSLAPAVTAFIRVQFRLLVLATTFLLVTLLATFSFLPLRRSLRCGTTTLVILALTIVLALRAATTSLVSRIMGEGAVLSILATSGCPEELARLLLCIEGST